MEASAVELAKVEQRVTTNEGRLDSMHKRMGEVQIEQGGLKTTTAVMANELKEAREDIENAKNDLSQAISLAKDNATETMEAMQKRFDKKFETMTSSLRWATGVMVALIAALIPIILHVNA